jgi:POT family proton-dependent oligopeptide transporter
MELNVSSEPANGGENKTGIPNPIKELVQTARDLRGAPRVFWIMNYTYMLDGMAYFGMLTLLTIFLHQNLGLRDSEAHLIVSVYTGLVTAFMLTFGPVADRIGIKKALTIALLLQIVGRFLLPSMDVLFDGFMAVVLVCLGLAIASAGNGFLQPALYAGIKQFSDEKTSSMGYGLLYAMMNLGIVIIGLLSSPIRAGFKMGSVSFSGFGVNGVFWLCIILTGANLLLLRITMTKKAESQRIRVEEIHEQKEKKNFIQQWLKEGPVSDARFMFFIFILLPVNTLFAHQWLTMPEYVTRAFSQGVADRMEWIVNISNPLIIVLGVPVITALTRRINVYTMMIAGSIVSALPTFLLAMGPNFWRLMSYMILFSFGEAMWQPRFLEYAAELAPPGKTGAYIALANVPWFIAKMTTGFYSGFVMETYCPEGGPFRTEIMWTMYGIIAVSSPIGLLLARTWIMRGFKKTG